MNKIYGDMDRATLDREYSAVGTVPSIDPILARYAELSAEARATLPCYLDVAYGTGGDETMDVFPAGPAAPVFVFLHGGYWRRLSKDESSFMARTFVEAGVAVAAVNYTLAPAASLDEIVRQCRAAVAWLHANGPEFAIAPDRLFIGGSSAGAHLAGMLLAEGWHYAFGVPKDLIRGASLASGLYDLEPVRLCHPNEWLSLDAASAARNSPIHHLPDRGCPIVVVWSETETSEFRRQSRDFAAAWAAKGFPVTAYGIPDRNHFDNILDLADRDRRFARDALALVLDE